MGEPAEVSSSEASTVPVEQAPPIPGAPRGGVNAGEASAPVGPPDPERQRSALWKDLPAADPWCPAEVVAHEPSLCGFDYQHNAAKVWTDVQGWRIVAASRRGRNHAHRGTHREDSFNCVTAGDLTILCVADGAGSAKLSRVGSEVVCRELPSRLLAKVSNWIPEAWSLGASDELLTRLRHVVKVSVEETCAHLSAVATQSNNVPKDFRCTLLLAAFHRGVGGDCFAATQVGDGTICQLLRNGEAEQLTEPDSGDFSGEVTCFVPDACAPENAAEKLTLRRGDNVECLLLCSDGVDDPFFPMRRNAVAVFRQLYNGVNEPFADFESQTAQPGPLRDAEPQSAIVDWLSFVKRGENDDRTIVLLYRVPVNDVFRQNGPPEC